MKFNLIPISLYLKVVITCVSFLAGMIISPRIVGGGKAVLLIVVISTLIFAIYKLVTKKKPSISSNTQDQYHQMVEDIEELKKTIETLQAGIQSDLQTVQSLDQEIKQLEQKNESITPQLNNIVNSLKQRPVDEAAQFLKNL